MRENDSFVWNEEGLLALSSYLSSPPSSFSKTFERTLPSKAENELATFLLEHQGQGFSKTLLALIDVKGYQDVEVYKKARVDRRVFSKIRSEEGYQPSRETAIRFTLALGLSELEASMLLATAGFSFSRAKKEDLVVLYCLEHGIHDLEAVNEALRHFGLPTLD